MRVNAAPPAVNRQGVVEVQGLNVIVHVKCMNRSIARYKPVVALIVFVYPVRKGAHIFLQQHIKFKQFADEPYFFRQEF